MINLHHSISHLESIYYIPQKPFAEIYISPHVKLALFGKLHGINLTALTAAQERRVCNQDSW